MPINLEKSRAEWVSWLESYGAGNFYDSFVRNAQDAMSRCIHCHEHIYLDIVEGGGVPDWHNNGDYGCSDSPDTNDEGTGGHEPVSSGRNTYYY